jgi:hypothetical protein
MMRLLHTWKRKARISRCSTLDQLWTVTTEYIIVGQAQLRLFEHLAESPFEDKDRLSMDTVCALESGPKTEIKLAAGPLLLFLGPVRFLKPRLLLFWKDHFLFIVFQKLKFVSKTNYHIQLGGAISTLSCFYEGGRTWLLLFFLLNFILKYLFNFELISLNSLVCFQRGYYSLK